MLDKNDIIVNKKQPKPRILRGAITPYISKDDDRFREYINITKKDIQSDINVYPIHLTEMMMLEHTSLRQPFHRYEYAMDNSPLCWIPSLTELVIYDDYGIDLYMQEAIKLAKEHEIKMTYKKYFGW